MMTNQTDDFSEMQCGIVILNYNSYSLTCDLANRVADFPSVNAVCVVDNDSRDDFDGVFTHSKIHYIKNANNGGYSVGNNVGLRYLVETCKCDVVFIANPDVHFDDSVIVAIRDQMKKNPDIALLSTKRYGHNRGIIHQYFDFPNLRTSVENCFFIFRRKFERNRHMIQNERVNQCEELLLVDAVPGAFFGMRSDFIRHNNYLYEGIYLYGEELILGRQAHEIGYKAGIICTEEYIHDHVQKRFSNRKMFWYDRKSLKIYYSMFEHFSVFQKLLLNVAISLGTLEYNCMYVLYHALKK